MKDNGGMGIRIYGAHNVTNRNPLIIGMWGDGIYIGGPRNNESNDILIQNALLDNNRRNGISITSGKNVNKIGTVK